MLAPYDQKLISAALQTLTDTAPRVMRDVKRWFEEDVISFPDALAAIEALDCLIRCAPVGLLKQFDADRLPKHFSEEQLLRYAGKLIKGEQCPYGFVPDVLEQHETLLREKIDCRSQVSPGYRAYCFTLRRFQLVCAHLALLMENAESALTLDEDFEDAAAVEQHGSTQAVSVRAPVRNVTPASILMTARQRRVQKGKLRLIRS